jgi:Ulp1 family protease
MFETGTYSHAGIQRWAMHVPDGDVFKLGLVLIPVNVAGSHWTLCVADITNQAKSDSSPVFFY